MHYWNEGGDLVHLGLASPRRAEDDHQRLWRRRSGSHSSNMTCEDGKMDNTVHGEGPEKLSLTWQVHASYSSR
jgi:hypothetical protein